MSLGFVLYRAVIATSAPALGPVFRRRAARGKEDATRLNERFAMDLPPRPDGTLVWLHGASVGESRLLLGLAERLRIQRPDLSFLFTSQTQTSAQLVASEAGPRTRHQMAPVDTRKVAQRFITHWRPDLAVIAEGEIWPNLIDCASLAGTRLALVNARMTDRSLRGWSRWPSLAARVFGRFDLLLAADKMTATGLSRLSGRTVAMPGNLKTALGPPGANQQAVDALERLLGKERKRLVAASTHHGEEEFLLKTWMQIEPRPLLIIAPRHPERGDEIEALLNSLSILHARRSDGGQPSAREDVYLADTLGEMGVWYRLADAVYLGGGHSESIGGHNPIEPVQLGKPVISGPLAFNFAEIFQALEKTGALRIAPDQTALRQQLCDALEDGWPIDGNALSAYLAVGQAPMYLTLDALWPLLQEVDG